jgi:hypothetical protein
MYVYAVYWPYGGQRHESAASNWVSATTLSPDGCGEEGNIPNAPTNFRVVSNPSYLVVAWDDNSFIETQYEIKFRVTGSSTWQTAYDSANIEQRIFDYLPCGTSYEMYVYAVYWPSGGQRYESASSNWINPTTQSCN